MNNMHNAHAVFCRQLLDDFCGEITGKNIEILEGVHPQDRFLVGMLSPRTEEFYSGGSDVIVHQLGMDMFFKEEDINNVVFNIKLHGDLFYRAKPTLEQQRKAFLNEVIARKETEVRSFEELIGKPNSNIAKIKCEPIPIYKKISLESILNEELELPLEEVYSTKQHSGELGIDHPINNAIDEALKQKSLELRNSEDAYRKNNEKVVLSDLESDESWNQYLIRACSDRNPVNQSWYFLLSCDTQLLQNGLVRVSIKINNDSKFQNKKAGKRSKDKERVNDLFNAGITIGISGPNTQKVEMEYFKDDYKYDRFQYAIGSNCSVESDDKGRTLRTTLLPIYEQKRLKTNDMLGVYFSDLEKDCVKTLNNIHEKMREELRDWENKYHEALEKDNLTHKGRKQFKSEIDNFRDEIARYKKGIELIKDSYITMQSFLLMNQTFMNSPKGYKSWRLFQIVFIVSLIPDIVACDPQIMSKEEKAFTRINAVDVLYFPTGGGKTEAFLGIMVFNLFFDRLRGKTDGVTAIIKYPLRLLSVQQVQRVADILAVAERIRKALPDIENSSSFQVGYYVGDNNTPNKITGSMIQDISQKNQQQLDESYRVVDRCPFCGKMSVHIKYDQNTNRLLHVCEEKNCKSGDCLNVMIVDTDIYRYLPSVIISTIDKLAAVGLQRRFKNILGSVSKRCPIHGYHETALCEEECTEIQEDITLYDPAPSLFIQDELHLVRESLGTYDSHFESFFQYFLQELSLSKRPAKIIGATATISSYREQVKHLYLRDAIRFPCQSPYKDRNFYAEEDANDLHRLILGYTPFGRAIINSVVYSLKYMHVAIHKYMVNPSLVLEIPGIGIDTIDEAKQIIEDYWIMLEYNNVKVDGNNVINALDDPINTELSNENVSRFNVRKMTGDETFQDIRNTFSDIENSTSEEDLNLIVATSMISHGVDADRFNNMFFFGIPGNMAEYIQAYSRVGRKYAGIVVDIIRPTRERELSYQKNFIKVHEYKDILIDPVPLNRWASRAIEQTLPSMFSALILNHYLYLLSSKRIKLYMMPGLKQAVKDAWIKKQEIRDHLYYIYGCSQKDDKIGRGNQYRHFIDKYIDDIFDNIDNNDYDGSTYITSGLGGVMTSMRETDKGLQIELR